MRSARSDHPQFVIPLIPSPVWATTLLSRGHRKTEEVEEKQSSSNLSASRRTDAIIDSVMNDCCRDFTDAPSN